MESPWPPPRQNSSSSQNLCTEGAPAPTEASEPVSEKPNRPQSAVRAAEAAAMVDVEARSVLEGGRLKDYAKFNSFESIDFMKYQF